MKGNHMETKTCTKCGETKTTDMFYAQRADCKECTKKATGAYYRNNSKAQLKRQAAYYEMNRDDILVYQRKYHAEKRRLVTLKKNSTLSVIKKIKHALHERKVA